MRGFASYQRLLAGGIGYRFDHCPRTRNEADGRRHFRVVIGGDKLRAIPDGLAYGIEPLLVEIGVFTRCESIEGVGIGQIGGIEIAPNTGDRARLN